jgi:solute carrier family 26 (sodium-independent sulfate anion transporter), member 11
MPPGNLISKSFPRAVAPFVAATIEHLAIAKGFARKNGYVMDPAQELVYLGVTNFFNSFFSSMPVGGAMSRTAVNSATGVKSPAYGIVAGGVVVLSIFKLSPALFWIPKATLAAIIVVAVWSILSPLHVFRDYWRTSFVDFIASMLAFWVTLFVSSEIGIGTAVGFQLAYHILYTAFSRVRRVTSITPYPSNEMLARSKSTGSDSDTLSSLPSDIQVFKPHQPLIFYNAFNIKGQCYDAIQTYSSGDPSTYEELRKNRNWSTAGERRAAILRRRAAITTDPPQISVIVLDLSMVSTIDTTGLVALKDLKADLEKYGGSGCEVRFAEMNETVRTKFERFGWQLVDVKDVADERRGEALKSGDAVYVSWKEAAADGWRKYTRVEEEYTIGSEKV